MTKDEIFNRLKDILVKDFEIEAEKITPESLLVDELDLDSIDFVDLIVKMKEFISERINPDVFKSVKTIQDAVDKLEPYINKNQ
ncbi:MAG: acyl carrier protein [Treponema sp.]|nr:acyl carrier protein [Treponema sp.]